MFNSLYGPFTEELDSMILVGPFQLRTFCDSVVTQSECHATTLVVWILPYLGAVLGVKGRVSVQSDRFLISSKKINFRDFVNQALMWMQKIVCL